MIRMKNSFETTFNGHPLSITRRELPLLRLISNALTDGGISYDGGAFDTPLASQESQEAGDLGPLYLCDTRDISISDDPLRRKIGPLLASLSRKGIICIEYRWQKETTDWNGKPFANGRAHTIKFIDLWGYPTMINEIIERITTSV